jgi:signal transduction histidine kinase
VLAIAAHDLKNPLNGIKGYSEMILEDPEMPPEEREDALRRILASAARMHELVRNLLDINALEDGKLALNVAPCDLGEVVRGVGESYAPAALAKRQTLLVLASSAPLVADRAVLVQVTDNLVSNAVKYSRPEGRIELRTECASGRVRLVVKDDGPGFEDDRKKLFGKFARLSARPTAGEHSNGLGLSIVKRLIEATGGTVALESVPGQGATFVVEWITTA